MSWDPIVDSDGVVNEELYEQLVSDAIEDAQIQVRDWLTTECHASEATIAKAMAMIETRFRAQSREQLELGRKALRH